MADITDALMCIGSSGCSEPCSYEQRRWPKPKRHYVDAAIVNPILMLTYLGFILQCFCFIIYVFEYPLELPVRLPCWNTLTSILATVWIPRWLWSFLQPMLPVAYLHRICGGFQLHRWDCLCFPNGPGHCPMLDAEVSWPSFAASWVYTSILLYHKTPRVVVLFIRKLGKKPLQCEDTSIAV